MGRYRLQKLSLSSSGLSGILKTCWYLLGLQSLLVALSAQVYPAAKNFFKRNENISLAFLFNACACRCFGNKVFMIPFSYLSLLSLICQVSNLEKKMPNSLNC